MRFDEVFEKFKQGEKLRCGGIAYNKSCEYIPTSDLLSHDWEIYSTTHTYLDKLGQVDCVDLRKLGPSDKGEYDSCEDNIVDILYLFFKCERSCEGWIEFTIPHDISLNFVVRQNRDKYVVCDIVTLKVHDEWLTVREARYSCDTKIDLDKNDIELFYLKKNVG